MLPSIDPEEAPISTDEIEPTVTLEPTGGINKKYSEKSLKAMKLPELKAIVLSIDPSLLSIRKTKADLIADVLSRTPA